MKPVYECEWCSFRGTIENVEYHERTCEYNPKNIQKSKEWIRKHCPHCRLLKQSYVSYIGCKLKPDYNDICKPTENCLQYCED